MNDTTCFLNTAVPVLEAHRGSNFILHDEYLANLGAIPDKGTFVKALKDEQLQLQIVVGYRRFADIIASWKNQYEKGGRKAWPPPRDPKVPHSGEPPKNRSRTIPSPPYFDRVSRTTEYGPGYHVDSLSLLRYAQTWNEHSTIRVFNVHYSSDDDVLIPYFMCDILRHADHSCQRTKQGSIFRRLAKKLNPSISLDHDLIAVEAADRHLINTTKFDRPVAVKLLADCSQNLEIPQSCPSKTTLEALLAKSLNMELEVVRDYKDTSPELVALLENNQAEHKASFWSSTDKYCSADISVVMDDPQWLKCFEQLR
jgi:hypothetical protein